VEWLGQAGWSAGLCRLKWREVIVKRELRVVVLRARAYIVRISGSL